MEEENIHNTLDGGPELANIFFSQCIHCVHFDVDTETCSAFPDGIPDYLLYEMGKHDIILPGQRGDMVFKKDF